MSSHFSPLISHRSYSGFRLGMSSTIELSVISLDERTNIAEYEECCEKNLDK